MEHKISLLEEKAVRIRKNIIQMITNAKSGHPGGSLSAVEILTTIYFTQMDITPKNAEDRDRDRFVLSKGHISPALYAVFAEAGMLQLEEMNTFRRINSRLQGHPNMNDLPFIDMSTGSLGQGISAAVGMAMANKMDQNGKRIYTLLGDGECEEGQVWEAAMAAAHYRLDNLIAVVDLNGLQIDGKTTEVMNPLPLDEKFKAFGWSVFQADGHSFSSLLKAFDNARQLSEKPAVIIARTVKGKGVSFMENNAGWHGTAPNQQQCEQAIREITGSEGGVK